MRELNHFELTNISGGAIRPSEWTFGAGAGALVGAACLTLTAFSANPVTPLLALTVGPAMGAGLFAVYDILHEYGL